MSLKDNINNDIHNIFLNALEFADVLQLQVDRKQLIAVGSLQSNKVYNNSGGGGALQSTAYTLYLRYPLLEKDMSESKYILSTGTNIIINNIPYRVGDISDEMGLAAVQLQTTNATGIHGR